MSSFPNGLKNYLLKIKRSPLLSANKMKRKIKRVKSVNALREKNWDDRFIYEKIPLYDSKNDKNAIQEIENMTILKILISTIILYFYIVNYQIKQQ